MKNYSLTAKNKINSKSNRGFSLVEISVVVVIIGLLASLSIQYFGKVREKAQNNTVINDLRIFSGSFHQYVTEKGSWPRNQRNRDTFPRDMTDYLPSSWARKTPIGGKYSWDNNRRHKGVRVAANLNIRNDGRNNRIIVSRDQLRDIDAEIDDGNLNTGLFRLGRSNWPIYILEE